MLNENIKKLRKQKGLTQEQLAEKLNITRQSVAKWEKGESIPDIYSIMGLSEIFNITIDEIVRYLLDKQIKNNDEGKYVFGTVKVSEKGQILIPKRAREIFNINSGDYLIFLGDIKKGGMAITKTEIINDITDDILNDK